MVRILMIFCSLFLVCCTPGEGKTGGERSDPNWTVMFYVGADNNLEPDLLQNIGDLTQGYQGGCNVVILIDRSGRYSSDSNVLGEDFSGCRIYQVKKEGKLILHNRETDFPKELGYSRASNIHMLKYFIEYSKKRFPAKHYALFLNSHGGGARNMRNLGGNRQIISSDSVIDSIYTHEFTDFLDRTHSVDLLAMDACLMGNLEFLYQLRPDNNGFHADYVVASPPTELSHGWDYESIFSRITDEASRIDGTEKNPLTKGETIVYNGSELTPYLFGKLLIETHYSYTKKHSSEDQALSFYDMSKVTAVKKTLDELFVLSEKEREQMEIIRGRGELSQDNALFYFDSSRPLEWLNHCYFDVYDFADRVAAAGSIPEEIKKKAAELKVKAAEVILYSFSGNYFRRFSPNVHGLSFFLPDANGIHDGKTMWNRQTWYNANRCVWEEGGGLSFCRDGAIPGNRKVENYFEVLDAWFDKEDGAGGVNGYSY